MQVAAHFVQTDPKRDTLTALAQVAAYCVQMAAGGVAIGAACGALAVWMIGKASRKTENHDSVPSKTEH